MIVTGDCLVVLPTLDAESIDAIVTDPPYGLEFMGREWDRLSGQPGYNERGRVTSRDASPYTGAQGRGVNSYQAGRPMQDWHYCWAVEALRVAKPGAHLLAFGGTRTYHRLASAIEDAGWEVRDCLVWAYAQGFPKSHNLHGEREGWGTALKPAWEPIVMARKPLHGTVAANVAEYGTGALNIDDCRIDFASDDDEAESKGKNTAPGRWPANVILTDPIFDGETPGVMGGGRTGPGWHAGSADTGSRAVFARGFSGGRSDAPRATDSGTYSRFFLVPKASRTDREPALGGLTRQNVHPTVKPVGLMRHLVRLVTPPGGVVLDPFLGSGSTALACEAEGFRWIGIERDAEYVAIAEGRLNGVQRGLALGSERRP